MGIKDRMSETSRHEWAEWLQLPCTRAYFAHVQDEWGAGGKRFERMFLKIADQVGDDVQNMRQMQQIAIARREILILCAWPEEEMQRLRSLEPQPAGMSRRGAL